MYIDYASILDSVVVGVTRNTLSNYNYSLSASVNDSHSLIAQMSYIYFINKGGT